MNKSLRILLTSLLMLLFLAGAYRLLFRPVGVTYPPAFVTAPSNSRSSSNPKEVRPSAFAPGAPALRPDPSPRTPVRELLRRAGAIVDAYLRRNPAALPADIPAPQNYATNLPVGYFQLLVRAFPEEAYEVYSTQYLGDPARATVAYWALGELARLRHEATFQLFNAQLENGDVVRTRQALKALANYDVPQLGPRILALVPADPKNADQADLLRTAIRTAASNGTADRSALDRLINRFEERARREGIPDFYGTSESRLRSEVFHAADFSSALADVIARETEDHADDLESVDWAAGLAVRAGRRELVPALKERIRKEVDRLKSDERLDDLDVLGREREGRYDLPSAHALGGLEEVRAIAQLRRWVLDLGGDLSEEDRLWLDGLRMLRPPRDYLNEAGLTAP